MKKITILLLLIFGLCIPEGYAQDAEQPPFLPLQEESVSQEQYIFPEIKPEILLTGGYRFVHSSGSGRAEQFEYLHNSFVFGGEVRNVTKDHRLHLDLEEKNKKDYYGDLSYSYKDLIRLRGVNTTLFHNLDHVVMFPFDNPSTLLNPDYPVSDRNPEAVYGRMVGISNVFLRFKAPDYPAHLYIEGNFVDRDSSSQQLFYQQFLAPAAPSTSPVSTRTSRSRNTDMLTSIYTFGANSHLGPLEADLSHSEKRFDVSGDTVLRDSVSGGGTSAQPRTAGDYNHNLIPELKSSTNTLKLHTSYTGALVGSATISKTDKENRHSGASADYLSALGDVTWMPFTQLTFFVKYRHQERDVDNPETATVTNLSDRTMYSYFVRKSISSISDSVSGIVRYRPWKGVILKADYTYEDIRRSNTEEWVTIPDSTQRNKFSLSGDVKIMPSLKFRVKYIHKDISNPATNIEPDHSDEGLMSLSWMPFTGLSAYASYGTKDEKRGSLEFSNGSAESRKVRNDRATVNVSYAFLNNLALTAGYSYMHDNVRQDIKLSATDPAFWDNLVPYKTTTRNYLFDVNYSPKKCINLSGGIIHTVSQGTFYTSAPALDSLASYSALKIREITYRASGAYEFKGGVSAGLQYRYSTFKDLLGNIYDDVTDGRVGIVLLTISKKW